MAAQVTGTLDFGLSAIRYEGFLGSGAAFLNPALRYDARSVSAAAQASLTVFESGRSLVQGTAAAAWLSPAVGAFRADVSGFGGLSAYADAPGAGYGLLRARVHAIQGLQGAWGGAGIGQTYAGSANAGTSELAVGAWLVRTSLALGATAMRSQVRDTAYVDLSATMRWSLPGFELDGLVGVRPWSEGGDEGPFGELTARLAMTRVVAAQFSAGRYLTDPLRGSVAGRSFSAGVRITPFARRAPVLAADERLRSEVRLPTDLPADAPVISITTSGLLRTVTIRAPGARLVEIAGDFTDWEPQALQRSGGGDSWLLETALPVGVHRFHVRLDGGAWVVPRGVAPQQDEFGGRVGLLVVR